MEPVNVHNEPGKKSWLILSIVLVLVTVFLGIMSNAIYTENLGTISLSGKTVVFSLKNSEVTKNALDGIGKMASSGYSALQPSYHQLVQQFNSQKMKLRISVAGLIISLIAAGCCFARHRKLRTNLHAL